MQKPELAKTIGNCHMAYKTGRSRFQNDCSLKSIAQKSHNRQDIIKQIISSRYLFFKLTLQ